MALIRARKSISLSEVKTGHVLEINYDGDDDLILVIDPNARDVANTGAGAKGIGQGRAGKLHAIKLRQLVESDLADLISIVRTMKSVNPRLIYDIFKSSPYASGRRNYRTYTREKINNITRISVGQPSRGTNKLQIKNSILYGVNHGSHVEIRVDEYDTLARQLTAVNGLVYHEGTKIEPVVKELIELLHPNIIMQSWEPPAKNFSNIAAAGELVAGWWNQTFDDEVGFSNIKDAWVASGKPFTATIGEAFFASVGGNYQLILDNFTDYSTFGRYSKQDFLNTLNEKGFNADGSYTEALYDFNQAGHDQVFPEDSGLPPGNLKSAEQAFNLERDNYIIHLMKNNNAVFFAGSGHLDNIRKLI
jgi:hypothetical protein